jgi:hypothetical protein
LNEFGVEQLNQYCAEAIPQFQSLSQQIRSMEKSYNESNPSSPTSLINEIQSLEQAKFILVVGYIKQQVQFFSHSCPHNHMKPVTPQPSSDDWKQQIYDNYKIEDKSLKLDEQTEETNQTTSTTTTTTTTTRKEEDELDCNSIHGEHDHDEHEKMLAEAKRNAKITFLTQLGDLDEQINDIMDDIRSELVDLIDIE